jgi:hypothetical protein
MKNIISERERERKKIKAKLHFLLIETGNPGG